MLGWKERRKLYVLLRLIYQLSVLVLLIGLDWFIMTMNVVLMVSG